MVTIAWTDRDGRSVSAHLLTDAAEVAFEECLPVPDPPPRRRQPNVAGWWWSATTRRHARYRTRLQRHYLIELDHDQAVVALTGRAFELSWYEAGRVRSHVPAIYGRRTDGTVLVIDCRHSAQGAIQERFDAVRDACVSVGWSYQVLPPPDPVWAANLRWIAGYRHPRFANPECEATLLEVFSRPTPLLAGASGAGEPLRTLPVLYHLLWRQELQAEMAMPLGDDTLVGPDGCW